MDTSTQNQTSTNLSQAFSSLNQIPPNELLSADILQLMGAENMPEEQKNRCYQNILETIQNRVFMRLNEALSDDDAKELAEIIDAGDGERFKSFLSEKNINLEKFYAEEALIYKMEMIDLVKSGGVNA